MKKAITTYKEIDLKTAISKATPTTKPVTAISPTAARVSLVSGAAVVARDWSNVIDDANRKEMKQ